MSQSNLQAWIRPEGRLRENREYEILELDIGFEEFVAVMAEDRVIVCRILVCGAGESIGERIIFRRIETCFRGSAILRAQVPTWRFVEAGSGVPGR